MLKTIPGYVPEYRALAQATCELLWLQSLFQEIGVILSNTRCPILWCYNIGGSDWASNPVFHAKAKHIEVDAYFIREKVASNLLDIRYVPKEEQVVDTNDTLFNLRGSIGEVSQPESICPVPAWHCAKLDKFCLILKLS